MTIWLQVSSIMIEEYNREKVLSFWWTGKRAADRTRQEGVRHQIQCQGHTSMAHQTLRNPPISSLEDSKTIKCTQTSLTVTTA